MLDWINALACFVLMLLTAPIAVVMRNDGNWPHRLTLAFVLVLFGLQAVQPISSEWISEPTRIQMLFNVVLLCVVISARSELMALVRLTVGKPPEAAQNKHRRVSDITAAQMAQVHGKGIEQ